MSDFNQAPGQAINANTQKIINVTDPVSAQDGATKNYVDTVAAGLSVYGGVEAATTATLNATYVNATGTLTNAGSLAAFSVDGYSPAVGQKVLVKNQSSSFQNGIYSVTTVGSGAVAWVLTRATDYNTAPAEIFPGNMVFIASGTVNGGNSFVQTATVTTIGTDAITFSLFGSAITALTTDVTATGPGSVAATIAAGAVTLAKQANLAANSIIGNNTGSPATPLALTVAQVNTLLGDVTTVGSLGGSIANGASISGNTITLGTADGTNPGLVTTGTQTIAGQKTLSGKIILSNEICLSTESTGDAASSIASTVSYHGVTAITVTRAKTLPAASGITDGHIITVKDESGSVTASILINVTPNGTDNIDGANAAVAIAVAYGCLKLIKRNGAWWSI